MKSPEQTIQVIEHSMRCFVRSLWGLFPVLGMFPAVSALFMCRRLRIIVDNQWNPAENYVRAARIIAWFGLWLSIISTGSLIVGFFLSQHPLG